MSRSLGGEHGYCDADANEQPKEGEEAAASDTDPGVNAAFDLRVFFSVSKSLYAEHKCGYTQGQTDQWKPT